MGGHDLSRQNFNLGQVGLRLAGGGGLSYLLRDDFTTAAAAPLASPRTCEPGPGTLTITDTENKFSVNNGALQNPSNTATGSPGIWGSALSVVSGRAVVASFTPATTTPVRQIGWDSNTAASLIFGVYFVASGELRVVDTSNIATIGLFSAVAYRVAVILRASGGAVMLIKGGAFVEWTLLWAGISVIASAYPAYVAGTSSGDASSLDNFRVLDLPAPFNDSFGLATQRLAGARSVGDTFTHEANCVIEFVITTLVNDALVRFRNQDANNYWQVGTGSAGSLTLREIVGGVNTLRGSAAAGTISNGHRIVVIADGTTIRVYSNNVLRITYASATNFATETDGELSQTGASTVSDIVSWPRVLTGTAAAILDQAVA